MASLSILGAALAWAAQARLSDRDALRKARIEAARQWYETARPYYQQGRITIDRLITASKTYATSQADAANVADSVAAYRGHLDRMTELEQGERRELKVGRSTEVNVAEAAYARIEAEWLLSQAQQKP
jgi:outer membrane protein TolC